MLAVRFKKKKRKKQKKHYVCIIYTQFVMPLIKDLMDRVTSVGWTKFTKTEAGISSSDVKQIFKLG